MQSRAGVAFRCEGAHGRSWRVVFFVLSSAPIIYLTSLLLVTSSKSAHHFPRPHGSTSTPALDELRVMPECGNDDAFSLFPGTRLASNLQQKPEPPFFDDGKIRVLWLPTTRLLCISSFLWCYFRRRRKCPLNGPKAMTGPKGGRME